MNSSRKGSLFLGLDVESIKYKHLTFSWVANSVTR